MAHKTIAITGSTGFVGRAMVQSLLQAGHHVRALARSRDKARDVLPNDTRVTLVLGDASNPADANELVRGSDAIINLVGIIREDRRKGQTFQRAHVDIARILVGACEQLGCKRFLQMSAMNVSDVGVSEYQQSKWDAEAAIRFSSLQWTMMRPGLIHGPDGDFIKMAQAWCKGDIPPYFFLPYFTGGKPDYRVPLGGIEPRVGRVAPIAVEDVCSAFVAAISNEATYGEVYNLAGPETMTWPEMLRTIRDNTPGAHKFVPFGIPAEPVAIVAQAADLLGLGGLLPFDAGMARMGAQDSIADTTKARIDFGFKPRPFTKSYAQYAAALAH